MNYYLILALALFIYMNSWFFLALAEKRNDLADIAWGLGFIVLAWLSFFITSQNHWRAVLVNCLVTLWGVRLAWHIYQRNLHKQEDYRYAQWRRDWGKFFLLRTYFQVFILQGVFLFIVCLPILYINRHSVGSFTVTDGVGIAIWLIGFFFETVGDWQLTQFKNNPDNQGKIIQSGLWQYSRHPNYFGEVTLWWGIFIIALSVPNSFFMIIGPLTITYLIFFFSCIHLL